MIWLIGNKGMLGSEVQRRLEAGGLECSATDMDVDITSPDALREHAASVFTDDAARWIINCSAYTAVDKAEDEPELAAKINTDGVRNIAECAAEFGAKMVHISTDYVFDGKSEVPLTEDMPTGPVGVYGKTKLEGEQAVAAATGQFFIIRTAWLYGSSGANFVYTMLKLMEGRDEITVVNDQHGSPTNAADLASLIVRIAAADSSDYGIYHYSNEGNITWFDFAKEIYAQGRAKGLVTTECSVKPCSSNQFPTKATRPEYSLLSKEKVKGVFGVAVPDWKSSLEWFVSNTRSVILRGRQWKELALEDFESAEYMFNGNRYSYVYFMCQQAIEKLLKSIIEFYSLPPKIHNLVKLSIFAGIKLTKEEELFLMKLYRNYTRMRYPELNRVKPSKTEAEAVLKDAGELICKIKTNPMFSML